MKKIVMALFTALVVASFGTPRLRPVNFVIPPLVASLEIPLELTEAYPLGKDEVFIFLAKYSETRVWGTSFTTPQELAEYGSPEEFHVYIIKGSKRAIQQSLTAWCDSQQSWRKCTFSNSYEPSSE